MLVCYLDNRRIRNTIADVLGDHNKRKYNIMDIKEQRMNRTTMSWSDMVSENHEYFQNNCNHS